MKKFLLAASVVLASTPALADGFKCSTSEGDLDIKVFNHVQPEEGTRTAAVMILSNPLIGHGKRTIARFSDANQTLDSEVASYSAKVDLRFNDSNRGGELIAGTKLGQLASIYLDVDFSYADPVEENTLLPGELELVKRNGDSIFTDVICQRYLKK